MKLGRYYFTIFEILDDGIINNLLRGIFINRFWRIIIVNLTIRNNLKLFEYFTREISGYSIRAIQIGCFQLYYEYGKKDK